MAEIDLEHLLNKKIVAAYSTEARNLVQDVEPGGYIATGFFIDFIGNRGLVCKESVLIVVMPVEALVDTFMCHIAEQVRFGDFLD